MNSLDFSKHHIFQRTHTDCGPSSLSMVYSILGAPRSLDTVLAELGFSEDDQSFFTYAGQLGTHLQRHGVKTRITISNPRLIPPAWAELEKDELVSRITKWMGNNTTHSWHIEAKYVLEYLSVGGVIELRPLSVDAIRAMLDRRSLLLPFLDEVWVWGHRFKNMKVDNFRGNTDGHVVVVTHYDDQGFHILDPYPTHLDGKHGVYSLEGERLAMATLLWDGMIVEVFR